MELNPDDRSRAFFLLHISIVLYGITGILGKLIELEGLVLVWYRMVITLGSLLLFPGLVRKAFSLPLKKKLKIIGLGVLLSLHWVTFFDSIRYSNVSITLSCMASTAFFTSLLEPLLLGRRIQAREMLLGALVIVGFIFMFEATGGKYLLGMGIAIASAIIIALVGIGNKVLVNKEDPKSITLLEFVGGVAFLTLAMPFYTRIGESTILLPSKQDLVYLVILALLCTTLAYNLTLYAMRHISAYTVALSLNLEPIYAIIMAWIFFREDKELNAGFYLGAAIILMSVFLNGYWERRAISSRKPL